MSVRFSFIAVILLFSQFTHAEIGFELTPQVILAYKSVIDFDFIALEERLPEIKGNAKSKGLAFLLENYKTTVSLLLDENDVAFRQELYERESRIAQLELGNENDPLFYYCLSEIYLQWTLVRIKYNDSYHAAIDLRQAAKYLRRGRKVTPDFKLYLKGEALVEAMASSVPENFQWLAKTAGISGTMTSASLKISELSHWLEQTGSFEFIRPEIDFFKYFIQWNLEDPIVLNQNVSRKEQESSLALIAQVWIAIKNHKPAIAIRGIDTLMNRVSGIDPCYLNYLKGEAKLNLLVDPTDDFMHFLSCTKGMSLVKSSYRKLAWYALLQGDVSGYLRYKSKVISEGNLNQAEDRQAMDEMNSPALPNKSIIRARILFDGGKYASSISEINQIRNTEALSTDQQLEINYRKARAYQLLKNDSLAIQYFQIAANNGANSRTYYAASACLQLGFIFRNQQNRSEAIKYFQRVSKYPNSAYKNSLEAKANACLSKMKFTN